MRSRWRHLLHGAGAAALLLAAAACASGPRSVARPSAFPGAPPPPPMRTTAGPIAPASLVDALLATATALIGSPYVFGGASPETGFDCSGFVRYVFERFQVGVPRTAAEQFEAGTPVADAQLAPGDLIFFSTIGPGATHVGIVVDPAARTFVHAPGTGAAVRIERFDTGYWQPRTLGVRRLPLIASPAS